MRNYTFSPTIQEPSEADVSLDTFRSLFELPLMRPRVSEDGTIMIIRVKTQAMLHRLHKEANRIIRESGLPLTASSRKLTQRGYIIDLALEIEYQPSLNPLLCY